MFQKKGIVWNTFLFTSLLITLVLVISLGILYLVLPDYYTYSKNKVMRENADVLVINIKSADTQEEISDYISNFSVHNNAMVFAYDTNDDIIADLSSPFNLFYNNDGSSSHKIAITIQKDEINTEDKKIIKNKAVYVSKNGDTSINMERNIDQHGIRYLSIFGTMQPINEAKNVIISLMPYLLGVNILISLFPVYFYSRKITRPIVKLSDTARDMQNLSPGIVSGIRTNDEMGELSENLDSLYEKLCSNITYLQQEMDKVTELEKSKTDFMRAASHELKTPISALNGIVEGMIDDVGKYKDRDKYLKESKKLIDNLTKLLSEILYATKLDSTDNIMSMEKIYISKIIEYALENNHLFIEEKKLKVTFDYSKVTVNTDEKMIKTVISNIISNAVKYTVENGDINIIIMEEGDQYYFSVENQSSPIPEEELEKLFEPFYTRNYSRSRSKSGTGLGLYIVKRNLESLQLTYRLESTERGLKFSIYFEKG